MAKLNTMPTRDSLNPAMATPSGRTSLQTSEASPSDPLDRSYGAGVGLRRGHRVAVGTDEASFGRCVGEAAGGVE